MKPPIPYYGGKGELAENIAQYVPAKMDRFIEPFFGSGGLFFYRQRWAKIEIINDLNGDVVNFFRVLRDHPKKLIDLLQLTPHARQEQKEAAEIIHTSKDATRRALYFFVRMAQSFNGARGWSIPVTKAKAQEWKNRTDPAMLYQVAERLQRASIENKTALQVMKLYDKPSSFFYLDPPYLSVNDPIGRGTAYRGFDMLEKDHQRFIDQCLKMKSQIIISGYDHPYYDAFVQAGWNKVKILTEVKSVNHRNITKSLARTEILWLSPNIKPAQNTLF